MKRMSVSNYLHSRYYFQTKEFEYNEGNFFFEIIYLKIFNELRELHVSIYKVVVHGHGSIITFDVSCVHLKSSAQKILYSNTNARSIRIA